MDRNHLASHRQHSYLAVATREGGVDRNYLDEESAEAYGVATREGGVDRNDKGLPFRIAEKASPPARVAWIET